MSEYLKRVNEIQKDREQRQAFNEERSCVVIAGPGSGKTYLLTTKVARLLFEMVPAPRGVACLTYSNLLAKQLEEDFRELGILGKSRLFVGTVHTFCLAEIIHPYQHLYQDVKSGIPVPFRIASEQESQNAIRTALFEQGIDYENQVDTGRFGQGWGDLQKYLEKYRRNNPGYVESKFEDGRWSSLNSSCAILLRQIIWSKLASRYVTILLESKNPAIDFTEIEILALEMVERYEFIRQILVARYPWLAIDEYQDLGTPFHRMISCLINETDLDIFAIGDPDQCIYEELGGTRPEYILQLAEAIKARDGTELIRLKHNYRCAQRLIDASEIILGESRGYKSRDPGGNCYCYSCNGLEEQTCLLLSDILPSLTEDPNGPRLALGEIAILHPWRKSGINLLAVEMEKYGKRWSCTLDKDIAYDSTKSDTIRWLERLARWCLGGWKVGTPYFRDLVPFWIKLNTDLQSQNPLTFPLALELQLFDVLWKLMKQIREQESKFEDWFSVIKEDLKLEELLAVYETVAPDDVAEFNKLIEDESGRLSMWLLSRFAKGPGRIQLTTLHSSKGTQFEAVIIMGLDKLELAPLSSQSRRLAYVAVTRAKKRTYILYEGVPQVLEKLKQEHPTGCCFFDPQNTSNGSNVWQSKLF